MDPGSGTVENSMDLAFCLPRLQSGQRSTSMLTGTLFCQSSSMCLRKFSSFLHCKREKRFVLAPGKPKQE